MLVLASICWFSPLSSAGLRIPAAGTCPFNVRPVLSRGASAAEELAYHPWNRRHQRLENSQPRMSNGITNAVAHAVRFHFRTETGSCAVRLYGLYRRHHVHRVNVSDGATPSGSNLTCIAQSPFTSRALVNSREELSGITLGMLSSSGVTREHPTCIFLQRPKLP